MLTEFERVTHKMRKQLQYLTRNAFYHGQTGKMNRSMLLLYGMLEIRYYVLQDIIQVNINKRFSRFGYMRVTKHIPDQERHSFYRINDLVVVFPGCFLVVEVLN